MGKLRMLVFRMPVNARGENQHLLLSLTSNQGCDNSFFLSIRFAANIAVPAAVQTT